VKLGMIVLLLLGIDAAGNDMSMLELLWDNTGFYAISTIHGGRKNLIVQRIRGLRNYAGYLMPSAHHIQSTW